MQLSSQDIRKKRIGLFVSIFTQKRGHGLAGFAQTGSMHTHHASIKLHNVAIQTRNHPRHQKFEMHCPIGLKHLCKLFFGCINSMQRPKLLHSRQFCANYLGSRQFYHRRLDEELGSDLKAECLRDYYAYRMFLFLAQLVILIPGTAQYSILQWLHGA